MALAGTEYGSGHVPAETPTASVTIRRTSPEDVRERELYVSLDGERIAILRFKDVITRPIAPGPHELRVHNTLTRKKARFEATAGQHVRFRTANVSGKGFSFLVLFMGVAPMFTQLEREEDGAATAP